MPISLRTQYNRKLLSKDDWPQWWISYIRSKYTCDKTNTLPKMKNCEEYTTICMHYLAWGNICIHYLALEISNEIAKNPKQRNSELKPTTMSRKNGIRQWTTIKQCKENSMSKTANACRWEHWCFKVIYFISISKIHSDINSKSWKTIRLLFLKTF